MDIRIGNDIKLNFDLSKIKICDPNDVAFVQCYFIPDHTQEYHADSCFPHVCPTEYSIHNCGIPMYNVEVENVSHHHHHEHGNPHDCGFSVNGCWNDPHCMYITSQYEIHTLSDKNVMSIWFNSNHQKCGDYRVILLVTLKDTEKIKRHHSYRFDYGYVFSIKDDPNANEGDIEINMFDGVIAQGIVDLYDLGANQFKFEGQQFYYNGVPCDEYRTSYNDATDKIQLIFKAPNRNADSDYVYITCLPVSNGRDGMFYVNTVYTTINTRIKEVFYGKNASTTEDGLMSKFDKIKLDGIENNSNYYIHPSTHPASIIVENSNRRFVTDVEKTNWNNKANNILVSTTSDGLMSKEDKKKLDKAITNGLKIQGIRIGEGTVEHGHLDYTSDCSVELAASTKNLDLISDNGEINMSSKDGIHLNTQDEISVNSVSHIHVTSVKLINTHSHDKTTIKSDDNVYITALKSCALSGQKFNIDTESSFQAKVNNETKIEINSNETKLKNGANSNISVREDKIQLFSKDIIYKDANTETSYNVTDLLKHGSKSIDVSPLFEFESINVTYEELMTSNLYIGNNPDHIRPVYVMETNNGQLLYYDQIVYYINHETNVYHGQVTRVCLRFTVTDTSIVTDEISDIVLND